MKKLFVLAMASFLFSGIANAADKVKIGPNTVKEINCDELLTNKQGTALKTDGAATEDVTDGAVKSKKPKTGSGQ